MLFAGVCFSIFVAIYVLRLIFKIYRHFSVQKQNKEVEEKFRQEHRRDGTTPQQEKKSIWSRISSLLSGMSDGRSFKVQFLIGVFLTNAGRSIILICDGIGHLMAG